MPACCAQVTGPAWSRKPRALLTLYQLLRMAMTDAIETRPGTDPDRASFTTAMEAARDQVTAAAGVCAAGLPATIGRAVLSTLLPARRSRYSARIVKCSTSRGGSRIQASATFTAIAVTMRTPPLGTGGPGRSRNKYTRPRPPQPPTRRERITAIITSQPPRDWSGKELAELLNVSARNLHSQLAEWTRFGFFTRTGFGIYRLNTPTAQTSSTTAPDP